MDPVEVMNDPNWSPFDGLVGVEVIEASGTQVVLRLHIDPRHHQPYGIVHGGIYCTLAESAASIGGVLAQQRDDAGAVGQSNHTEFLRAIRGGTVTATATPVHVGRTVQVWEVSIADHSETVVARSTVRLFNTQRQG